MSTINTDIEDYFLNLAKTILVRLNSQYLMGATITGIDTITAWFNNQPYHAAPLTINAVHNAVIRAHLGSDHTITIVNSPLPYTADTRLEMINIGGTMGFQLAINIGFAMSFVAAFYALSYIKERSVRSKLLQFVSGVKVITFWLTAFIWDYLTFILTILCLMATFAIFQERGWSTALELSRVLLVLLSFGVAMLPITYILSRFFVMPASGFTSITIIYVLTGKIYFLYNLALQQNVHL